MLGRSIRIFLADGTPTGLRTAEIGLSTVKAVIAPRAALAALGSREESRRTGVYVLVGEDPQLPGRLAIYVGEGDDVFRRIVDHDRDPAKDFWDRVAIFVSKDQNLTKAHVRFLEAKLIAAARAARRATVVNGTQPEGGSLPESDQAEMETFVAQIRLLLATLGVNVFEASPQHSAPPTDEARSPTLALRLAGDGYAAHCRLADGEFVVLQGSLARRGEARSLSPSSKALRAELGVAGVLREVAEGLEFVQDYAFSSASSAAQVVCGANVNGKLAWKLEDGTTYKDWQERTLPAQA